MKKNLNRIIGSCNPSVLCSLARWRRGFLSGNKSGRMKSYEMIGGRRPMIFELKETVKAEALFAGWKETLIFSHI